MLIFALPDFISLLARLIAMVTASMRSMVASGIPTQNGPKLASDASLPAADGACLQLLKLDAELCCRGDMRIANTCLGGRDGTDGPSRPDEWQLKLIEGPWRPSMTRGMANANNSRRCGQPDGCVRS